MLRSFLFYLQQVLLLMIPYNLEIYGIFLYSFIKKQIS